ncbi:ABC transporter substrate-binding protein [Actinobaculum suis]|nr:ABC transporter substrate-binding protein [Actinobaculum suis]OCA93557.1 ABC transporter substrate-binding protein [Actinobaculum suis]
MKGIGMKKTGFIGALAAVSVVLAACSGGGSGSSKAADGGNKDAKGAAEVVNADGVQYLKANYADLKQGGALRLPLGELTAQQNRFQQEMTADTDTLWDWYNPQISGFEANGEFAPNPNYLESATSEVVDGNTVVKYKLNPKAKFNDDTPIDYQAFQTTWKDNNGTDEGFIVNGTDGYSQIKSVEKGDTDQDVVVTFDGAYPWWQGLFNRVLHPAVNTPDVFNNAYKNNVKPEWGAGPYKVEEYSFQNGTISFVPNEKWWGEKPKLDKVTFRAMDSQATINAFTNSEIDVAGVSTAENLAAVEPMSDINIYTSMLPANYMLTLNSASDAFKDPKVREAVMMGVDRSAIADVRFQGTGYKEELPGSFIQFSTQPGYEDNFSAVVKHDPEGAKKVLEEAGYTKNANGVFEKDGKPLSARYVIFGDNQTTKAMATVVQQQMKDLGIDLQIDSRASADFSSTMKNKDFDMVFSGFSSTDPFGVAYFGQIFYSPDAPLFSGLNKSGTGTPELDAKIDALAKISDPNEQIKQGNALEKEALAQYGLLPVLNGPAQSAMKRDLANFSTGSFRTNFVENVGYVENAPEWNGTQQK